MENKDIKQNMLSDEDLDQISGGRGIMDIFTTEFRGKAKKPTTLEMDTDEKGDITLTTLEMRNNPLDQKTNNGRKTIKL